DFGFGRSQDDDGWDSEQSLRNRWVRHRDDFLCNDSATDSGTRRPLWFRDHENLTTYREHMREQSTAGIVDRVMGTKEIRVVDLHKTEGMRTFRCEGVRSLVVVPLRTEHDALGIMYLGSRQAKEFEPGKIRLFEAIGTQVGIAVQKVRLFESVERRAKEQEALTVVATATNQSLDLK